MKQKPKKQKKKRKGLMISSVKKKHFIFFSNLNVLFGKEMGKLKYINFNYSVE